MTRMSSKSAKVVFIEVTVFNCGTWIRTDRFSTEQRNICQGVLKSLIRQFFRAAFIRSLTADKGVMQKRYSFDFFLGKYWYNFDKQKIKSAVKSKFSSSEEKTEEFFERKVRPEMTLFQNKNKNKI